MTNQINQPKRRTSQRPLKSVYLIHGEKKMIDEALGRLKKRISDQFDLDFNYDQFNGSSATAPEIIQAANTLPFMSEKRLVVVRGVDKLSQGDAQQLAKYAESPSSTTCLVLVAESVSKTSKLYKAVEKNGEVAEYKLKDSHLVWIKKEFKERGVLVSDVVARYIINTVGPDLARLGVEVEKASLYCDSDRIVDPGEIEAVITKSPDISIFDLAGHIGERNIPKAINVLHHLLQQKEAPLGILNLVARHFRLVLRAKVWTEEGRDSKYLVDHLSGEDGKKLPYFAVSKIREQTYNFTTGDLKRIFDYLLEADIALKSSAQPPEAILEDLIIKSAS